MKNDSPWAEEVVSVDNSHEKDGKSHKTYGIKHLLIGILCLFLLFILLGSLVGGEGQSISSIQESNPLNVQDTSANIFKDERPEQKAIREFLAEELKLDDELQRGNDEVFKAGKEMDFGVPLPYIIKAELIFESVLEESKALVVPSGAEKVKTYLVDATTSVLSGVRKIREALESYPVNKTKMEQGIEIYTKSQMFLARKNAEIDKLKKEAGI